MKTRKILAGSLLTLALMFSACKKGGDIVNPKKASSNQNTEQILARAANGEIQLHNGVLIFKDEKQFNDHLLKVQDQKQFELPAEFKSLWSIYCKINEAEGKLADMAYKMAEVERTNLKPTRSAEYKQNLDIIKQKKFDDGTNYYKIDLCDYRVARFVNRFGFVVVGSQLRRYTEENCSYTTSFNLDNSANKEIPMQILFSYGNRSVAPTAGSGCGNSWNRYYSVTGNFTAPPVRNFVQVTQTQYDQNGTSYTFSYITGEHYRWSYWSQTFYPENTDLGLTGGFSGPRSPTLLINPIIYGYNLPNPFSVLYYNVYAATVQHFEDQNHYVISPLSCYEQTHGSFSATSYPAGGGSTVGW
jgi:hypothetical protein